MASSSFAKGSFFAFLAFISWGLLPLYWNLLSAIDSLHILAFRMIFSLVFVGIILLAGRNYAWLEVFRDWKKAGNVILAGLLIGFNWGLYIWAVNSGRTIEASLGYYINPLLTIVLGLLFFRERLRPMQWVAVSIALAGVLLMTLLSGRLPWVSLCLALSFGFYSVLKKTVALSALESLGSETLITLPMGLLLLCVNRGTEQGFLEFSGFQGLSYLSALPVHTWVLLSLCGAATMFPLFLFAKGAKLLPLSTIGFMQFIAPTITFMIGLLVFKESFPTHYFAAFAFIWVAVILYIISLRRDIIK